MKFYLNLLRRDGKRLRANEAAQPPRLIILKLTAVDGFRLAEATCCQGGSVVGRLWEPMLVGVRENDMMLRGLEKLNEASMAQEWRLRPHATGERP